MTNRPQGIFAHSIESAPEKAPAIEKNYCASRLYLI